MDTTNIRSVFKISTSVEQSCPVCGEWGGGDKFDATVRHMLLEHRYALLHVGAETSADDEGKPWHSTVAVVGTVQAVK